MRATSIIFRRELGHYFRSPLGWIIAAAVLLVDGFLFQAFALSGEQLSADVLEHTFMWMSGIPLFAGVLLSFRLIAEERQNHSMVLLKTSPIRDTEIVLGKGKILGAGSEGELAKHEGEIRQITVTVRLPSGDDGKAQIVKVLGSVDGVSKVADPYEQGGGMTYALSTTKDCRAEVSRAVVNAKLDLLKLDYARSELENTFIRLVGGSDASN